MLKGLEYETVFSKMIMAFVAAVVVVLGVILLMGIQLMTCSPIILSVGVAVVTALLWICSLV